MSMIFSTEATISNDLIQLFRKKYESYVLEIMNMSKKVFPGRYEEVVDQSHGECDFVDIDNGQKFDAKLPFTKQQVELLSSGEKHKPLIDKWIKEMYREAADFDVNVIREGTYDITETTLYSIIYKEIEKDKADENIVLFIPFPIVRDIRGSLFLQFAGNYLTFIYDSLQENFDFSERSLYAIYPLYEKDYFGVRNLKTYQCEYIKCKSLSKFFTYDTVGFKVE